MLVASAVAFFPTYSDLASDVALLLREGRLEDLLALVPKLLESEFP